MFEKTIMLKSFEDVKKFVDIACSKDYDIELLSGKYIVNAKSIMGVFSLDLTKVIKAEIVEDKGDAEGLIKELAPYIVD